MLYFKSVIHLICDKFKLKIKISLRELSQKSDDFHPHIHREMSRSRKQDRKESSLSIMVNSGQKV